MNQPSDIEEGRIGMWMQTSLGGRFWPDDPRGEEVFISDIANGLAGDWRYAGQGRLDRYYSVAEHCVHVSDYLWKTHKSASAHLALAGLLHDASEAYINDLNRATKNAVGEGYKRLERNINSIVWRKYQVAGVFEDPAWRALIKEADCRIVPLEKAAMIRHPRDWAYDDFEPMQGVTIECWEPQLAKMAFLNRYVRLAKPIGLTIEEFEI